MNQNRYEVQELWSRIRGYNCFGCAPHNDYGLSLSFVEHESDISAPFKLSPSYSSFPGVVHCGIIATILEEVMGNVLVIKARRLCFTLKLSIKYVEPVLVNGEYTARANIESTDGDYYEIGAGIYDRENNIVAAAKGSYKAISPQQAMRAMDIDESTMAEFMTYLRNDSK